MAGLAVVALLGWVLLRWLPSDQKAIEKAMRRLAEAASVDPQASGFVRLSYPDRLAAFFTTNAVLHLDAVGGDFPVINGRTDLLQAATAARAYLRRADFQLADLNVTFPGEPGRADAYMVITGHVNRETNQFGQAFRLTLRKLGGRWLIQELNAVERQ
ncbi:MAG: nuclear transport factor 2 family protein [Verrucomicrobiota bacterium]